MRSVRNLEKNEEKFKKKINLQILKFFIEIFCKFPRKKNLELSLKSQNNFRRHKLRYEVMMRSKKANCNPYSKAGCCLKENVASHHHPFK